MDPVQSDTVIGTADITTNNSTYYIPLSGLEEDTTYNYTVTASNCIGNTATATMSFRTLSTGKCGNKMIVNIITSHVALVVQFCDPENAITEQFGSYSWPETAVGDTVTLPCVFRPGHNASRTCTQGGSWVAVDVTDCRISE